MMFLQWPALLSQARITLSAVAWPPAMFSPIVFHRDEARVGARRSEALADSDAEARAAADVGDRVAHRDGVQVRALGHEVVVAHRAGAARGARVQFGARGGQQDRARSDGDGRA